MKVMKWFHLSAVILLCVLMARSAFADVAPELLRSRGSCSEYVMCIAAVAAGDCVDAAQSSDEIVLDMQGNTSVTAYSTESSAATYSCDFHSNIAGHDAATPAGDGHKVNGTSLTETVRVVTFSGAFSKIWATCPTVSGAAVRITANICRDQGR